ncbi:MAG: 3-methyl-2-oxobutanoate hydroxymethyltransferase [Gammaproteobacteria bacterium]|nr:3-methyl-2-oxobutanoate hydroxymethyltransferase [Gammaproteobacteria bacterium]
MKLHDFARRKNTAKITVLTCYDYPSACSIANTSLDCILVGDSVAMTVHGHTSTIMADMDMMVMHTAAVARGLGKQFLIADLPFLCHRESLSETMTNIKRLVQAGAHAVKIEGGDTHSCDTIAHIVTSGVPIIGHIGLTPQSVLQLGGYKVQGRMDEQAEQLLSQARQLEAAGCVALVLECIPTALAKTITNALKIPTIGIGAGSGTDGQVLVWHDFLGLYGDVNYRFVKQFADGKSLFDEAIQRYTTEVQEGQFPSLEHSFE